MPTRRYLWGTQLSAISLRHTSSHISPGGKDTPDQLKTKVPSPDQIFILGGGSTPDQLKSKVPSPGQIFTGGGVTPDHISEILLNQKNLNVVCWD